MSIALATTTITIETAAEAEPGEGRTLSLLAANVNAQIGSPSGSEDTASRQRISAELQCDVVDGFDHTCIVTDEATGEQFEVLWVKLRLGLGLDHMKAGLAAWDGGGR